MTSSLWSRVAPIVEAALLQDEQARAAFVTDACRNDEDLLREVESLLAHASGAADFLSAPALALARAVSRGGPLTMLPAAEGSERTPHDASRLAPGQRVGLYRIERLLGCGGMGEVYEAEHLEHGRRVALKVLSPGLSDVIDTFRFLREGQLAAAVNHPHVVYIYGSEDISGMPAIAMELLPGGTLKERVEKEGPLASIEAIDAILQVVSGLDAAHDANVLHRDVKPSNCFVDEDGTVKVGDFGLAIPAVEPMQLAAIGTIQATPQFASPEQLRGTPLDMRSDIYAVGATLYYLLTGRPPFDDRDLLALVSRIATESPISPREIRPEVPRALAAIVLQCLAKNPADRPASYRVLASVLEPLGSTVKMPAPLGMRFAVGILDNFFSTFLLITPIVVTLGRPSSVFGARLIVEHLVEVAYFAISESVWGASLGKALCGFRVVSEHGARPRFVPAFARALIFVLPPWFASGLVLSVSGLAYSQQLSGTITAFAVQAVVTALLFAPSRRANGFAGIHEWATGTRTVLRSAVGGRGHLQPDPVPAEVHAGSQTVGPYRIVETSSSLPSGGATLGYDDRLRRTVWLRLPGVDADPVPHARRISRRPTRPRWLAGQRATGLAWDAYERVPGQPFATLATRARSWEAVRGWLCDLGEEVQAGLRDGSLPALEFDRVWIGDDGRARLLDWPAANDRSDLAASPPPTHAADLRQAQRFLHRVAVSALEGHVLADDHPQLRAPRAPLPMPATDCLAKLGGQRFTTSEEMLAALTSAARGPAAISRRKRAVHLSLCAVPTMLILLVGLVIIYVRPGVVSIHPRVRSVTAGEAADRAGVEADDVVAAVDGEAIAFASQLTDATAAHAGQPIALSILRDGQPLMIHATPARTDGPGRLGITLADETPELTLKLIWRYLWLQAIIGLMVAGTLGLLSAFAARGGIALRLMSIAVVTRNGVRASGSRARLRAVLSWLPVLAAAAAAFAGHSPLLTLTPPASQFYAVRVFQGLPVFFPNEPSILFVRLVIITVALAVFAFGVIVALIRPERGLQDRLAGTSLVPR